MFHYVIEDWDVERSRFVVVVEVLDKSLDGIGHGRQSSNFFVTHVFHALAAEVRIERTVVPAWQMHLWVYLWEVFNSESLNFIIENLPFLWLLESVDKCPIRF